MRFFLLISFVAGLLIFGGCEKSEMAEDVVDIVDNTVLNCPVPSVPGPEDNVIGKWKLVKVVTDVFSSSPKTIDYSCDNIIYHFRSDGIRELLVGNPLGAPDINRLYELRLFPLNESVVELYTLKIGDLEYVCSIDEKGRILKLNGSYIDDNIYIDRDIRYFVRIE